VVHDAHLFVLQIHASNFETSWWGEMVWLREAFHRLGIQDSRMSQSLILIDALSSACWGKKRKGEKEKKKKQEKDGGHFSFPRAGHALLAMMCRIFRTVRCN
jgi:hypothetical protein